MLDLCDNVDCTIIYFLFFGFSHIQPPPSTRLTFDLFPHLHGIRHERGKLHGRGTVPRPSHTGPCLTRITAVVLPRTVSCFYTAIPLAALRQLPYHLTTNRISGFGGTKEKE